MPVSTNITTLKYASTCALQVESITVGVTSVTTGTLNVSVTASDIAGSAVSAGVATLPVPVTAGWSASQVADAIKTKMNDTTLSNLSLIYTVGGTSPAITLTRKVASNDDATLLVSIPASQGVTAGTSTNTTAGGTFAKLIDIISYPDLGSAPSKLDTTDMSQTVQKTAILGLQDAPDLTFECNYTDDAYNTIMLMTGTYFFQLVFGSNDGKFDWQGQVKVFAKGAGVDEVRKMTVIISPATPLTFNVIN